LFTTKTSIRLPSRPRRLDPNYLKAFYRRGSAHYALGKVKEALKDFKHVVKVRRSREREGGGSCGSQPID